MTSPFDYLAEGKSKGVFADSAPKWARRILALTALTRLIRDFKTFEQNAGRKVKNFAKTLKDENKKAIPQLINYIPSSFLAKIPKPKVESDSAYGSVWSRIHDCELLLRVYEHGCENVSGI